MYLDYAATTPLKPQVKDYIISLLGQYQNPSSMYQSGVNARKIITTARNNVAKFINANPENIIFTSGGSASNTLAIKGYESIHNCIVYYSPLLHKSALKYIETLYYNKEQLKVNRDGLLDVGDLEHRMNALKYNPFVVIEYANSEIGTIQNVKEIINITHKFNGIVYLDCTGSIPTIPLDVKELNCDLVGFSAHKLGALKGIGVLYKKSTIELEPLIYGTQEQGLFAGTENTIGIGALGKAIENYDYSSITSKNRDYVYEYILKNIPSSYLIGESISKNRLPHNLYVCFKGIQGESLMTLLDMDDIQVSTGSACTSGDLAPSSTLVAIGMNKADINSCIRMSFSGKETKDDLNYLCQKLKKNIETLRQFNK